MGGSSSRPTLVCLLPARNCEADLPGYLESVGGFADAVVALDDGSTDRTGEILAGDPLVKVMLSNPRREGYAGWDDSGNRSRLLAAAADLHPRWILSLDADERIDADDAKALREFVERDALPGFAYGFRVFRMIGDLDHYDRSDLWVYRLFAHVPGHAFSDKRLHFVPVPTSIPRAQWLRTTIRIQHTSSLTDERRRARFDKYQEADPRRDFQQDYDHLLDEAGPLLRWERRPAGLPVLERPALRVGMVSPGPEGIALDGPVLSAIVIAHQDEARIEQAVGAVVAQECEDPYEVIVVASGTDRTAEIVRERFPSVRVIVLPGHALPGRARNAGLAVARGEFISFPGSHVELPRGSLAARIRAHELGYSMVTGSTLNGTKTASGWAAYFLDHSGSLPGRPSGPLTSPPGSCSYARWALVEVGGFPEDMRAGEDTVVNSALWRSGHRAYRAGDVHLVHHNPCQNPLRLIRHHFIRGRAMGRMLRGRSPWTLVRWFVGYVPTRLRRTSANVRRWGGPLRSTYYRVVPLVLLGTVAAFVGTWFEIVRAPRRIRSVRADLVGSAESRGGAFGQAREEDLLPRP